MTFPQNREWYIFFFKILLQNISFRHALEGSHGKDKIILGGAFPFFFLSSCHLMWMKGFPVNFDCCFLDQSLCEYNFMKHV